MVIKKDFTNENGRKHWRYYNSNGDELSIIDDGYGEENGLFETMCSWLPDVQGHLTFKQVAQKIDTIIKRDKKEQGNIQNSEDKKEQGNIQNSEDKKEQGK